MRFRKITDGSTTWYRDASTKLEWSVTAPKRMTWKNASKWCERIGGRLPTVKELLTLVDYERSDPATELPDTASDLYWSSSTYRNFPTLAWFVYFSFGYVYANIKDFGYRVRAVRGGS